MSPSRTPLLLLACVLLLAVLAWWNWPRDVAPATREESSAPLSQTAAEPAAGEPHATAAAATTATAPTAPAEPAPTRTPVHTEPLRLHGTLTREGLPMANRRVHLIGTQQGYREVLTDPQGRWSFDVNPGAHQLAVAFAGVTVGALRSPLAQRNGFFAYAIRKGVELTNASLFVPLQLPAGAITIRAMSAKTNQPLAAVEIGLRRGGIELFAVTDAAGMARYDDLAFARHLLTIAARGYTTCDESVELAESTPRAHIDVLLAPVGAFDLRLLDDTGQPVEISAAIQVAVTDLREQVPVLPSNMRELRQTPRPKVLRFDDLQADRFRIALHDEICGERILRYQPVDATAAIDVEVPAGVVTPIDVHVRYRAYVRLRALDRDGAMGDGVLAVERLDEREGTLRILPAPWQRGSRSGDAHFDGYLAPGTYALTFSSGERQHRDTLVVTRENVDRSLPLPW